MLREKALAITFVFLSLEVMAIFGFPVINIPYLSGPARYKKNDLGFPVVQSDVGSVSDGDVLELEHLKSSHGDQEIEENTKEALTLEKDVETLPELESELEAAVAVTDSTLSSSSTTTTVRPEIGKNTLHHSPVMPSSEQKTSGHQASTSQDNMTPENSQAVPSMAKTAKSLLHHRDGQYSSFDMAQYIFWTGDESGVAHAVEECIQQGLMSRENALKFLRDIRMGIEYLQRSYENRVLPENIRQNSVKKSYTARTTTSTTTTESPLHYSDHAENSAQLRKTLDNIALWNKLQELNADGRQDLMEYDEATGRAKIAEFLYTHYTVEDILYKLAKVMFTQSLAHGSDDAQRELQKLTDFLEREGNLGVIPIDLQKKVLHVLLSALSDTLTEHPELLPAARQNLINPYERLPLRAYGVIN